jgi:hypothetical protein
MNSSWVNSGADPLSADAQKDIVNVKTNINRKNIKKHFLILLSPSLFFYYTKM